MFLSVPRGAQVARATINIKWIYYLFACEMRKMRRVYTEGFRGGFICARMAAKSVKK